MNPLDNSLSAPSISPDEASSTDMTTLDARGLKCPLPVLKAGKILRKLEPGTQLEIWVTDPGAPKDFEHFCQTTGTHLVGIEAGAEHMIITLQREAVR